MEVQQAGGALDRACVHTRHRSFPRQVGAGLHAASTAAGGSTQRCGAPRSRRLEPGARVGAFWRGEARGEGQGGAQAAQTSMRNARSRVRRGGAWPEIGLARAQRSQSEATQANRSSFVATKGNPSSYFQFFFFRLGGRLNAYTNEKNINVASWFTASWVSSCSTAFDDVAPRHYALLAHPSHLPLFPPSALVTRGCLLAAGSGLWQHPKERQEAAATCRALPAGPDDHRDASKDSLA